MQQIDRRVFVGMAMAAGAAAAMPAFGSGRRRLHDHTYFEHQSLRDGAEMHAIFGEGGNSLLITSRGQSMLIDCKLGPFGTVLRADIETLGAAERLTVINTHHHGGSTGGNIAFNENATIYCHENAIPRFEANMGWYRSMGEQALRQLRRMPGDKRELAEEAIMAYAQSFNGLTHQDFTPPAVITEPRFDLNVGDHPVIIRNFGPGHTDNDLVIFFPDQNVLHTGDLVFNKLNPIMDADGGCDARRWMLVLRNVVQLCDDETIVVPGHGEVGDRTLITDQIYYIQALFDAVADAINDGMTREQIVDTTFSFQEGFGFDQGRAIANGFVYDSLQD
ncbi:MAG: MBL fold metallo-hydrolase [Planctomycetota bacterium]